MKVDITTFGSATIDYFISIKEERIKNGNIVFNLGEKMFVRDIKTFSGGGGTNTAVAFSNLGIKSVWCGKIGNDEKGEVILSDLKKAGSRFLVKKSEKEKTPVSIIFSAPQHERAIIALKGASHNLKSQEIEWKKIQNSKWFYIASLNGEYSKLFSEIIKFAKEHKIKVAVNLGEDQIKSLGQSTIYSLLKDIAVLILNEEEAKALEILDSPSRFLKSKEGVAVITKGERGVEVFTPSKKYEGVPTAISQGEKTGAGDAFASGFVAGLFWGSDIEYAIRLGMANAAGCIKETGAKSGLLKKNSLKNIKTNRAEIKIYDY